MRSFLIAIDRRVPRLLLITLGAAAIAIPAAHAAPSAIQPPGVHALEDTSFFFRAKDGSVLALLMLQLLADPGAADRAPEAAASNYVGAASVQESSRRGDDLPGSSPRTVPLELATGATQEGRATFFGRVYLQSGRSYSIRYVVKDAARDEIFLRNLVFSVPYLSDGFSASSIVPAEEFGPAGAAAGPFQVGSEEVVPKAGGVFRRSELLRLYLQVYDAAIDPETSKRRVDVSFRFYRSVKGASKRHGKPFSIRAAAGPSMGLALPIGDWPTGRYRVVVELHDRVRASRTTTEAAFSIVAD